MTLEEALQEYDHVMQYVSSAYPSLSKLSSLETVLNQLEDMYRPLISPAETLLQNMDAILQGQNLSDLFSDLSVYELAKTAQVNLELQPSKMEISCSCELSYLTPTKQEQYNPAPKHISPIAQALRDKQISFSDIMALLSVLISLYFGICTLRPDPQTERLIALEETRLEQDAEQHTELMTMLGDILEVLTDSLEDTDGTSGDVPEIVNDVQNSVDDANNTVEVTSELEDGQELNDCHNAQE